jgi:hypothetical protein
VVPERPTSLRYIEDWKVDLVLQIDAERLERMA